MSKKNVTFEDLKAVLEANNELLIHEMKDIFVTKEDIKHLPTKEEYYKQEDIMMKEIRDLRDEVTVHNHQVQRNASDIRELKKAAFKN